MWKRTNGSLRNNNKWIEQRRESPGRKLVKEEEWGEGDKEIKSE